LEYPTEELRQVWETVLLQQFHDILPGSSIAWVHREAEANYARVAGVLEGIIERSLAALVGDGDGSLAVNSSPVTLAGIAPFTVAAPVAEASGVTVEEAGEGWVVDTGLLRVVIDGNGLLPSVVHTPTGRELVAAGRSFGLLQVHNDRPSMYEAWDIDAHVGRVVEDLAGADSVRLVTSEPGIVEFETVHSIGASTITTTLRFTAGSAAIDLDLDIDWHEQRRLLKLAFPTSIFTDRATSEIQFGHIARPTYTNTTWDVARYETCAHRWVQVAEPGFGFAVANDSTYGHDIRRDHPGDGAPGTTVRLSLIRGPMFPDPKSDQGRHHLRVSAVCGADIETAIAAGQRLNQPVRTVRGAAAVAPIVTAEAPGVLVEAVKLAEDGSGDVVVRLYESLGARSSGVIRPGFAYAEVQRTDLLERRTGVVDATADGAVELAVRPFEIVTLRFVGVASSIRT
jgi:alpha-mannosidase